MTTQQIADRLVALCREGKNDEAFEELYSDAATSSEMPGMPNEFVEGKPAIAKKSEVWFANVEQIHGGEVSDPLVAGNHFSCVMKFDITFKDRGRQQSEEIALYTVEDGKIVAEQFFYTMPD